MIRKSIFDNPTTPRLQVFLEWVRDGQLFLPDFQRPFEWDDQRRLDLLDSVARGLPIGAFLVWRTTTHALKTYSKLGPFDLPKPPDSGPITYLIDGHQRLTTLYAALLPISESGLSTLRQGDSRWPVYFDLGAEATDSGFVLSRPKKGGHVSIDWLATNMLYSSRELWSKQRELGVLGQVALAERSEQLSSAFKDYIVSVMPLVTDDLQAVTDSFVRVNNGGKRMGENNLFRALVYAEYRVDEAIERLRTDLAGLGWGNLEPQVFINALKVLLDLDVYRAGPFEIQDEIRRRAFESGREPTEVFQETMADLGRGLRAAIQCLYQWTLPGPAALPYQYQLIGLARVLLVLNRADPAEPLADPFRSLRLGRWLWATTYAGYFTGMTGSRIRLAIEHLLELALGNTEALPGDLGGPIDPVREYRFTSTRSLAFSITMLGHIPDTDVRRRAATRLGTLGNDAMDRIFSDVSGAHPGNRVITVPERLAQLREGLALDPAGLDIELADEHLVPPGALDALAHDPNNHRRFCDLRSAHIWQLEREVLLNLKLPVRDEPSTAL